MHRRRSQHTGYHIKPGFKGSLFFGFILFADKKLHWFDQVKKDDVAIFNAKKNK